MRGGYILATVGFFLSSFYLNAGGLRLPPPFLGLLLLVLGLSKIRNYYSVSSSRAAGTVWKLTALLSAVGSVISLSRFTEQSPLGFALPALPCIFAVCDLLAALGMVFFWRQAAGYFPKYSTCGGFWRVAGVVLPLLYCVTQAGQAAMALIPADAMRAPVAAGSLGVNLLLLAVMIAAAASDHGAVKKER